MSSDTNLADNVINAAIITLGDGVRVQCLPWESASFDIADIFVCKTCLTAYWFYSTYCCDKPVEPARRYQENG